uniref:AAA+ ATPase domain-containing protein n=1 Tax=Chaetoceros debilis TaxID=122233 RepID=A0A7S3Q7B9_9STRA
MNVNSNVVTNNDSANAALLMANHAAMKGMLMSTLTDAKKSTSMSGDDIEAIAYLLEDTIYSQDYGNVNANDENGNGNNGNGNNGNGGSCEVLVEALTRLALNDDDESDDDQDDNYESGSDESSIAFDSDAEVEAFWEEFPEFKVTNPRYNTVEIPQQYLDDYDDDGDGDDNEIDDDPNENDIDCNDNDNDNDNVDDDRRKMQKNPQDHSIPPHPQQSQLQSNNQQHGNRSSTNMKNPYSNGNGNRNGGDRDQDPFSNSHNAQQNRGNKRPNNPYSNNNRQTETLQIQVSQSQKRSQAQSQAQSSSWDAYNARHTDRFNDNGVSSLGDDHDDRNPRQQRQQQRQPQHQQQQQQHINSNRNQNHDQNPNRHHNHNHNHNPHIYIDDDDDDNDPNNGDPTENPFRTAREVRGKKSKYDGIGNNNSSNNNSNNNNGNNGNNNYNDNNGSYDGYDNNNDYGNNNGNGPSSSSYNPNRPELSAGLKRKFQPPKLGSKKKNINGSANNNNYSSNGNGNGAGRPRGNVGNGGQKPRTNSNSKGGKNDDDDDEDELPEELKGLDKELIAKIENEIVDQTPTGESITFQDIAGLEDAKQTVMELVCWPMKRPDLFTGLRRGPNGLLLFGPPGTGKTLIGKAIAHESGATFFSISSSSLTSKWIGEGEKLVRTLFAVAAYREPAVVFIDEIDSLLTQRKADENEASRRIKTEFLVQLDGTGTSGQGRVLAIGATNLPKELDDAARRRFVKRLYIPLPEAPDREILLKTLLTKNRHRLTERELVKLAAETIGFSGADLKALCTDAALGPIRELGSRALDISTSDVPPIAYKHFRYALKGMNPSVAKSDLDMYIEFNNTYGSKSVTADAYDNLSDDDDEDDVDDVTS